ncbi:hypothetical protein Ciccas_002176 [Cichlidogyrus casuarinus]|uniref:Uncharacterized protein n=1 Tax=Cichlidogyrus casuarinus TaxID=1844966 RepID=A0ABD2QI25_9PLAT
MGVLESDNRLKRGSIGPELARWEQGDILQIAGNQGSGYDAFHNPGPNQQLVCANDFYCIPPAFQSAADKSHMHDSSNAKLDVGLRNAFWSASNNGLLFNCQPSHQTSIYNCESSELNAISNGIDDWNSSATNSVQCLGLSKDISGPLNHWNSNSNSILY